MQGVQQAVESGDTGILNNPHQYGNELVERGVVAQPDARAQNPAAGRLTDFQVRLQIAHEAGYQGMDAVNVAQGTGQISEEKLVEMANKRFNALYPSSQLGGPRGEERQRLLKEIEDELRKRFNVSGAPRLAPPAPDDRNARVPQGNADPSRTPLFYPDVPSAVQGTREELADPTSRVGRRPADPFRDGTTDVRTGAGYFPESARDVNRLHQALTFDGDRRNEEIRRERDERILPPRRDAESGTGARVARVNVESVQEALRLPAFTLVAFPNGVSVYRVDDPEQASTLPPGTRILTPDGVVRRVER